MTCAKIQELFSWLPEGERPQRNSAHSVLFMIDSPGRSSRVCAMLSAADVKFTCEQAEDLCYEIEAQTED